MTINRCIEAALLVAAVSAAGEAAAAGSDGAAPVAAPVRARESAAVPMERLVVRASPEDVSPAPVGRWQRFEAALAGRGSRAARRVEHISHDGARNSCVEGRLVNACARSGGFMLVGDGQRF